MASRISRGCLEVHLHDYALSNTRCFTVQLCAGTVSSAPTYVFNLCVFMSSNDKQSGKQKEWNDHRTHQQKIKMTCV